MTYQQIVGNTVNTTGSNTHNGYTVIDLNSSVSADTVLSKAFFNCYTALSTNIIKIFRDDGTNYNFIGEKSFSTGPGNNIGYMDISVLTGDYIGFYCAGGGNIRIDSTVGSIKTKSGNISSNTLKSDWGSYTGTVKLNAGYDDVEFYVKTGGDNTKNGYSWTNAWNTINKAATTVTDGSTVRIGFGTYNAEPAGNKIAPQNAGASGIKYLCETATTGGGTGSVIVEKN